MPPKLLIDALGGIVRIDLDGLSDGEVVAVHDAWRDATVAGGDGPAVVPPRSIDLASMLESLSQQVTLAAIEQRRGELWMLHAAGVAADDGRVVVLVGPSGRGKTTAARTLSETLGYVSDETIAIDGRGRIWPYRKPLSVIEQDGAAKVQLSPSGLGLRPLPAAPLHLAAVVLLDRRGDASDRAVIEEVDLGGALEELVAQSSYLTAMDTPLQTMAALSSLIGGIRKVTYRESTSLPAAVEELLAASSDPAGSAVEATASGALVADDATRPPGPPGAAPLYSRTPYVDALDLVEPDRVAVLRATEDGTGILHVLAGVAPAIWRAADAASISLLTHAALSAYGRPPGDPTDLVRAAVSELIDVSVLSVDSWRIRDDVAWVDHGDRVVVLSLADPGAAPLALEGSAAVIWRSMTEVTLPSSIEAITQRVSEDLGVEPEVIRADIASFVEQLAESGLAANPRHDGRSQPRADSSPDSGDRTGG